MNVIMNHPKKKEYKCSYCGKLSTRSSNNLRHIKTCKIRIQKEKEYEDIKNKIIKFEWSHGKQKNKIFYNFVFDFWNHLYFIRLRKSRNMSKVFKNNSKRNKYIYIESLYEMINYFQETKLQIILEIDDIFLRMPLYNVFIDELNEVQYVQIIIVRIEINEIEQISENKIYSETSINEFIIYTDFILRKTSDIISYLYTIKNILLFDNYIDILMKIKFICNKIYPSRKNPHFLISKGDIFKILSGFHKVADGRSHKIIKKENKQNIEVYLKDESGFMKKDLHLNFFISFLKEHNIL